MILMTKTIKKAAQAQYPKGADMDSQKIVAKFFNPVGSWTWYLMNQDPNDPDYLWGIVVGHETEAGSFSLTELQDYRSQFGLRIERDKFFRPINAQELWLRLNK